MSILRYARNTHNRIIYKHMYTHTAGIELTAISGISANEFRTVKNDIKNAHYAHLYTHAVHMLYDI